MKNGTITAFRQFLNIKFKDSTPYRNGVYHQKTRLYGDYLYKQDHDKFKYELSRAMDGEYKGEGFDPTPWQTPVLFWGEKEGSNRLGWWVRDNGQVHAVYGPSICTESGGGPLAASKEARKMGFSGFQIINPPTHDVPAGKVVCTKCSI